MGEPARGGRADADQGGPPLGHLVKELGGQRPGGNDLEAPSGRLEHLLQHLQGQAILQIVSRAAEDGDRRIIDRFGRRPGFRRVRFVAGRRQLPLTQVFYDLLDRLKGKPLVVLGDVAPDAVLLDGAHGGQQHGIVDLVRRSR